MNGYDAVWLIAGLTETFESSDLHVKFPVDEWSCYLQAPFEPEFVYDSAVGGQSPKYLPQSYTPEWFVHSELEETLSSIGKNLTRLSPHASVILSLPLKNGA